MFKVKNKTTERRHWHLSGVFIVNFEPFSSASTVNFEQVNISWAMPLL